MLINGHNDYYASAIANQWVARCFGHLASVSTASLNNEAGVPASETRRFKLVAVARIAANGLGAEIPRLLGLIASTG